VAWWRALGVVDEVFEFDGGKQRRPLSHDAMSDGEEAGVRRGGGGIPNTEVAKYARFHRIQNRKFEIVRKNK
jgi:hypothetical protein